jgi:uncharacterized membrane protein YgcG
MLALSRAALLFFCWLAGGAALALEVPYLTGRITDNAELLNATTRQQLSALLEAHERKTGNQIAVLTLARRRKPRGIRHQGVSHLGTRAKKQE